MYPMMYPRQPSHRGKERGMYTKTSVTVYEVHNRCRDVCGRARRRLISPLRRVHDDVASPRRRDGTRGALVPSGARSPRRRHPSAHRPHRVRLPRAAEGNAAPGAARSRAQRRAKRARARRGRRGRGVARSEHGGTLRRRWQTVASSARLIAGKKKGERRARCARSARLLVLVEESLDELNDEVLLTPR